MSLVEWREEFKLGVASVDHEHRELIALINKVHDRMAEPGSDLTIAEYLGEIYARIAAHFALEERIMREARYDRYAAHKEDHERLLDEIRDIMDDYEDRRLYDESRLAARLTLWFTGHFKTHDARLHHRLPH
jgi:hemerythrin-like metal-binding protein